MLRERRKQGLAFWIECPWGVGREAGLVQIKLMLLMDLVLVEMGAAVWQPQNRWGRGFLEVELRRGCAARGPRFPFPEEEGSLACWVPLPAAPLHPSLVQARP